MNFSQLFGRKLLKVMSWGTLTMIFTFIQGVVIARFYGPELRGFAAVPIVFFGLLLPLSSLGLKQSISYFFVNKGIKLTKSLFIKLNALVLLTSTFAISLFFLNEPDYLYYGIPIIGYFLFKVFAEVQSYKFLVSKNVHYLNYYNFIRVFVELLLLSLIYVLKLDEHLLLYCYFIGALIYFGLVIKFDIRNFVDNLEKDRHKKISIEIGIRKLASRGISFALPLTLIGLNLSFDIIMLSKMKTLESVGIYQVAVSIANLLWVIPTLIIPYLFSNALYTELAKVADKLRILIYLVLVTIPLVFLITPFTEWVFITIYGSKFSDSAEVFNLIIFGFYIMLIYKIVYPFLAANGYTKVVAYVFLVGFLSNVILNLILIPQLDYFGAAIATLISYFICSLIFIIYSLRILNSKRELLDEVY